jgi:hypothetical protein
MKREIIKFFKRKKEKKRGSQGSREIFFRVAKDLSEVNIFCISTVVMTT